MRVSVAGLIALQGILALGACLRETFPPPDGGSLDDDGAPGDAPLPLDARVDAPLSGHDEDGDGIDDALDNCPQSANAQQRDLGEVNNGREADGVGDICDPDPDLPGNSILLFDGMYAGLVPGRWVATGASASGDSLRLDRDSALISTSSFPAHVMVNISASLTSVQQAGNAVIVASNYTSSASFVGCRREVTSMRLLYGSNPSTAAPPFSPAQEIWMEILANAMQIDCGTAVDDGQWIALATSTTSLDAGNAAVLTTGSPALVHFVVVIGRP
ncbi:MAG: thrombospondin type 3 repeat-containing protein [Deltaproteobacteria bacterium]|nr:thrombospondin type 3 repeat-containing protein [Kofleriaceae bacterium]